MNATKPRRIRRTHSEAFKQSLIEACGEPGASVAEVALANGINVFPPSDFTRREAGRER